MKKIKVCGNWDSSENLVERLIKQFKTEEINLSEIKFVFDESYDYIIFFNYITQPIKEDAKVYVFPHEPTFSGSHQKNFDTNVKIFGFEKELYNKECIETVAHTFYGGRGPWIDPLEFWSYDNLKNFNQDKKSGISCSISSLNKLESVNCLYPQRYNLVQMINSELPFVDIYGGWKNSPKRHDALVDYKFNISIENEHQKNWLSEKFYDAILTNTIPIYYGCKNIKEIYPEDGYILLESLDDFDYIKKTLKEINDNLNEIYYQKLIGLKKIKEKYFREYNLLHKIINL